MIFALKIEENNQERQPDYFHDKSVVFRYRDLIQAGWYIPHN